MDSGFKCTYVTLKQKIPHVFRLGISFFLMYVDYQVLQNKSKHLRFDRHERIWFKLGCFLDRTARSSSNVFDNYYIQFSQHNKMIVNEQGKKERNERFEIIYDI